VRRPPPAPACCYPLPGTPDTVLRSLPLAPALLLLACSDYDLTGKPDAGDGVDECVLDLPAGEAIAISDDCAFEREPGVFEPEVEWRWDAASLLPGYDDPMMMPAVGDVDGDGMPEVVITTFADRAYTSDGALFVLSGDDGSEELGLLDVGGYAPYGSGGVALGDVDADGTPEIVTSTTDARLIALHADGTLVWATESRGSDFSPATHPAIADLDGDGMPEVIAGRAIFDGASGSLVGAGAYGDGGYASISAVADLDVDGEQEVVAGNAAYHRDGSAVWVREDITDGWPAVADFDDDGQGEVVNVEPSGATVTLLDTDGATLWGPVSVPGGGGGPPTVADFDGDGAPEIGVAGASYYSVFDTDGSVLWSMPTQDASSQRTGSSVFDFEGDGKSEVVYADELTLWVFDGATGDVRLAWDEHASWTLFEYPVIVDIDADGASEIVFMSNDGIYEGWQGITAVSDAAESWAPTTPTWNQHAYHITNINDDLSVPAHPTMNWLTGHNSFRAGGLRERPGIPAPDLAPHIADVCWTCTSGQQVEVAVQVDNKGSEDVDTTVVAGLWARTTDGDVLVQATTWPLGVAAGTRSDAVSLGGDLTGLTVTELWVRVDDPDAWAAVGLSGEVEECEELNNAVVQGAEGCG